MLKLVEINDIELLRSDVPLYYIKNYHGKACFTNEDGSALTLSIHFVLELEPTGAKRINVQFNETFDYPVLPLVKMLKEEIQILDQKGKLL
jgi:hypothetical protein